MAIIGQPSATTTAACLIGRIADISLLAVSVKQYGIHPFTGRKD
jgi:hypothetical protein